MAKALDDLPSPVDLLCASSAPNALFAKRKPGYPWPHISLHDLTLPPAHHRSNVTFNMRSVMLSPTGSVPGELYKGMAGISLILTKLPPQPPVSENLPASSWPGLLRGVPVYPSNFYQLMAFFGVGATPNIMVDFEDIRRNVKGFAMGVDVLEMYAEVYKVNEKKNRWELVDEWEFCLDDLAVEVVEGGADDAEGPDEEGEQHTVAVQYLADGQMVDAQKLGEEILRDLRRL